MQATVSRSKGNWTDISEVELIQRSSYCRVSGRCNLLFKSLALKFVVIYDNINLLKLYPGRDMDLLELSAYSDVRRGEDSGGCKIQWVILQQYTQEWHCMLPLNYQYDTSYSSIKFVTYNYWKFHMPVCIIFLGNSNRVTS